MATSKPSQQLGKLDVLVAQLESMAASFNSQQHHLDPLICFDLLADLMWTIDEETKDGILSCQRKCEDALQNLLLLGVRPPVRHLASSAIVDVMHKGDSISIYSRASSLQGWLADTKKGEPAAYIGAAQCLGNLYKQYGQKITSNLGETSTIVGKMMKFQEASVRQAGMQLLQDALEGCGGLGQWSAYAEGLRITVKWGVVDKSPAVRAASAGCLRLFANTGGPGFNVGSLENAASLCVKALEDSSYGVQDGFAAALGALLALGLNPDTQIQPKGKGAPTAPPKALEGALDKYLIAPFIKASGARCKDVRVGITMAWVAFLQEMRFSYGKNDYELGAYVSQVLGMLAFPGKLDPHAQACVLYVLRVGIVGQMGEPGQIDLNSVLCKQLGAQENNPSMLVVILRTLSYLLMTLGEVTPASRNALDSALVSTISHPSVEVRIEAALALRGLAEVDPTCASNLMSCAVTTLWALHEAAAIGKGDSLRLELGGLHGQAAMLASLLCVFPKLPLGLPSRLPLAVLDVGRKLVLDPVKNPLSASVEKEAGWMLIAAFVSALPKEELQQKEAELVAVWTAGHFERINQAGSSLFAEIGGWTASVEALAAFLKNYVLPFLSADREEALLKPVLRYLNGALVCISSGSLQQAPPSLKPAIDAFTIKMLRAFRTMPSPSMFKSDHTSLLRICTAPFREPALYGGSSCLRQLLDCRDASLGPWMPGRDSFEDELRAFEGGANGLLPCVWEDVFVFPQPVTLETSLIDEMMLCLGNLFGAQPDVTRLQLLEVMELSYRTGKKHNWHAANLTNICVTLLGGLKRSAVLRGQEAEGEVVRRIQAIFQEVFADEASSSAHRRAAAEGLGLLAKLGSDVYAARLMRSLLADAGAAGDPVCKSAIAFALGCIHRSVGGMALSTLVPSTVQTICSLSKDQKEGIQTWFLHGLCLTIESAGLSFVPHVQASLSLVMGLLLSEEHNIPELRQSIGRVVNAIVAVLGPELSPGSSLFSRCKSIISVVSSGEEPGAMLEGVRYTQQLVLFAPHSLPVHTHVEALLPTLLSKQPLLRQAALSTLRHLCERDPAAVIAERIEEDLFAMLDTETDMQIIKMVRSTLERLLEAACPSSPSRWIQICRTVVLASSKVDTSGNGGATEPEDNDEGSMMGPGNDSGKADVKKEADHLPRFRTRVFAAECLSRIPTAVGLNPVHFNILAAREQQASNAASDFLVLRLGELVALAYQVATGSMESIRPIGVSLLDTLLEKFEKAEDPDPEYAGHLLLEPYQAQFLSAVRVALEPSAGPLLMSAGARLAARIVTSGVSGGDRGVLQRVLNLISRPLANWDVLNYSDYAEWVGCKVRAGLLGVHAAVKTYALACLKSGPQQASVGHVLVPLLANHVDMLNHCWLGLLKDYTMVCTQLSRKSKANYSPFLEGLESPAIAAKLRPTLYEVCALVLEAVAVDAVPEADAAGVESSILKPVVLSKCDFLQVWALSALLLADDGSVSSEGNRYSRSFPSFNGRIVMAGGGAGNANLQLVALRALRCLCSKNFYSKDMLSVGHCQELILMLQRPTFGAYQWAHKAILCTVDQIVNSVPDSYMENEDLVSAVADITMSFLSDLLRWKEGADEFYEVDDTVVCSAMATIGTLIRRSSSKTQAQLMAQLLFASLKIISNPGVSIDVLSSAMALITGLTSVTSNQSERATEDFSVSEKCSILSSAVESLAQLSQTEPVTEQKLPLLLGALVAIARALPDDDSCKAVQTSARIRCFECLRAGLETSDTAAQLAVLQTLAATVQAGVSEQPKGAHYTWALMLMHELGADVANVHAVVTKAPLTPESINVVSESLKLLLLFHALVIGEEAKREVLHVFLVAVLSATNLEKGLTGIAVKLVTHLASVPAFANQLKTVLVELDTEARSRLQDIIRSSATPDYRTASAVPGPIKVPLKPVAVVVAKPDSPPPLTEVPGSPSSSEEWDDFQ